MRSRGKFQLNIHSIYDQTAEMNNEDIFIFTLTAPEEISSYNDPSKLMYCICMKIVAHIKTVFF